MTPQLSIIIPTYKRPGLLRTCLAALAEQTVSLMAFEVIVVDDGNDPPTALATRQMAQQTGLTVRYLAQPERRGPAAARNRGWRVALAPLIAFTDDDCQPERTWLATALARFEQGAQVLTGQVVMPPDRHQTKLPQNPDSITANLFCCRNVLDFVGGFDEAFDSVWREDRELQFKIIRAGISISPCPEAVVVHSTPPAPWYGPLRDERRNRYDALLYKRHPHLFREHMPAYTGRIRRYYFSIIALMGGAVGLLLGQPQVALIGLAVWSALTILLFVERMPSQLTPVALGQTLLTSVATPFLSVYWRLHGAVTYRAWYL
ncbi:glycosyltransferase [Fibrella sp. WM1]|uniref:glycosyltransferase n=1 Tax=Fibrella musci TaxID=3242485 RepID=UPI003521BD8D